MAWKDQYTRLPVKAETITRMRALQDKLAGRIDSYLSRPSHDDVITYLLDWYDKFVAEADTSAHDTAYVLVVDGVERDNIIVSRVVAELQADAIKAATPAATVAIKELPLEELIDE